MAAQTLILQNAVLLNPPPPRATAFGPRAGSFQSIPAPSYSPSPFLYFRKDRNPVNTIAVRACSSTLDEVQNPTTRSLLTGSTRTVTTLLAISLTASKFLADKVLNFAQSLQGFQGGLPQSIINSAAPAFFAAIGDQTTGSLNTPFTVVAAGMAKWLDIYSGVLMVRVLLSWFPNIPWDRQPFSAVRDLCDPYLNLFRNIIPPIFDTLDVSPLLAFAVLGTLGSILKSSKGGF